MHPPAHAPPPNYCMQYGKHPFYRLSSHSLGHFWRKRNKRERKKKTNVMDSEVEILLNLNVLFGNLTRGLSKKGEKKKDEAWSR